MTAGPPGATETCACPRGCCTELARLREENALLRASAQTFGDLAERLNARLDDRRLSLPGRTTSVRNTA